jgi:antitoxin ParD1/3/4
MSTMNISLPDTLKSFVDEQVSQRGYGTSSEYVRELIRDDEKRKAEDQLEALLLEGMKGDETALTRDDWKAIREEAVAKVKARKAGR